MCTSQCDYAPQKKRKKEEEEEEEVNFCCITSEWAIV